MNTRKSKALYSLLEKAKYLFIHFLIYNIGVININLIFEFAKKNSTAQK